MLAAFVVMVREGLEGALIVSILAAYLKKIGRPSLNKYLFLGSGLAVLLSVAAALLLADMYSNVGPAFEGVATLLAVAVLTYMVFWMSGHAKDMRQLLQNKADTAVSSGKLFGLTFLAFISVFREGVETVLFLAGVRASTGWQAIFAGVGLGTALVLALSVIIFRQVYRFDLRKFFSYTSLILLVFGAGLVGQAVVALQAAGWLPGTVTAWNTNWLINEQGLLGSVLRALVGYSGEPSLLQIITYLGYLAMFGSLAWPSLGLGGTAKSETAATAAAPCQSEQYADPFSSCGRDYNFWLYRLLRSRWFPSLPMALMGVIFLALLATALFGIKIGPFTNTGSLQLGPFSTSEDQNSLFNLTLWIIWLPLVSVFTVLTGRLWCGNLCPLRLASDFSRNIADRLFGRPARTKPYMRVGWLLPLMFILITFVVKTYPVQKVARYGAILFLVIFVLASLVSFLFQRGTWCRYVCPIGGWLARLARLSIVGVRPNLSACSTCRSQECLKGTAQAERCPSFLNPSRLDSNRYCLECWNCVKNCPSQKSGMRVGLRLPGSELMQPHSPDIWESVFVFGLLGMYTAASRQGILLPQVPFLWVFTGLILLALLAYGALSWVVSKLGGMSFREALTNIGYIFLPFEFGAALLTFSDDSLSFFHIFTPAASFLLGLGFVWSSFLAVSILRNHTGNERKTLMALLPVAAALLILLFMWAGWYTSGNVIDLT